MENLCRKKLKQKWLKENLKVKMGKIKKKKNLK